MHLLLLVLFQGVWLAINRLPLSVESVACLVLSIVKWLNWEVSWRHVFKLDHYDFRESLLLFERVGEVEVLFLNAMVNLDICMHLRAGDEAASDQGLVKPCDRLAQVINLQKRWNIQVVVLLPRIIDETYKEATIVLVGNRKLSSAVCLLDQVHLEITSNKCFRKDSHEIAHLVSLHFEVLIVLANNCDAMFCSVVGQSQSDYVQLGFDEESGRDVLKQVSKFVEFL